MTERFISEIPELSIYNLTKVKVSMCSDRIKVVFHYTCTFLAFLLFVGKCYEFLFDL